MFINALLLVYPVLVYFVLSMLMLLMYNSSGKLKVVYISYPEMNR